MKGKCFIKVIMYLFIVIKHLIIVIALTEIVFSVCVCVYGHLNNPNNLKQLNCG